MCWASSPPWRDKYCVATSRIQALATVKVHVPSLQEGKIGFEDKVTQQYDVKAFESDKVPAQMLAVARCGVEFTDTYRETPAVDVSKFLEDGFYMSSTRQLRWKAGEASSMGSSHSIPPATKGLVGFAEGQLCELGKVTIQSQCRYAAMYVTAQERR